MFFISNTSSSDFAESYLLGQVEGEKHHRLLQLIHRIKNTENKDLLDSGKKDYLDLVLTVQKPFDYEIEMYDTLLNEIFDGKLTYNIPKVTTDQNKQRIRKSKPKKQQTLSDYL